MGDVTITYDRAKTVEFTFFTLVDSEAFVTHRPSKLNEAFALIRPFQWQVGDIFNLFIFLNAKPKSSFKSFRFGHLFYAHLQYTAPYYFS